MNEGDIVRLKQPIRPKLNHARFYLYGIVIKIIPTDTDMVSQYSRTDVLVNLYDPRTNEIYVDDMGVQAIYCFRRDELEKS